MHLLAELGFFSEVAKLQSFSRAAASLGVSSPTLSRRIAALEREMGVTLIRRSTRSFALTDAGHKLFEHAEAIVSQAARAREELRADAEGVSGHLRVGAPADLACTLLAPTFGDYCKPNEGASVSVLSTQNQPDLARDSLDLAFVVVHQSKLKDSAYSMHSIGSFRRMLFASSEYLEQHRPPREPEDLRHHVSIRHLNEVPEKQWELQSGQRRQTVPITGVCSCTSVIVCAQTARENLGVAMLPLYLATHPAYGAGLTRLLPDWEGTPGYVLALTADRAPTAKARELIRLVRHSLPLRLAQLEAVGRSK